MAYQLKDFDSASRKSLAYLPPKQFQKTKSSSSEEEEPKKIDRRGEHMKRFWEEKKKKQSEDSEDEEEIESDSNEETSRSVENEEEKCFILNCENVGKKQRIAYDFNDNALKLVVICSDCEDLIMRYGIYNK